MKAQKEFFKVIGILAGVGLFAILFSTLTGLHSCLLKLTIGIPCPACGMSRAVFAFLRGDFARSFHYHPLMLSLAVLPFLSIEFADEQKQIAFRKIRKRFAIVLVCLILITYVMRMIFLFPHTDPMTLNENAFLLKGLQWVFEILHFS